MNVTVQGNRLSIAFRYDLKLIEIVKTLPDRAYNHKQLPGVWSVPATPFHCAQVIQTLTPAGFYIDPKVEKCADTKADKPKLRNLPKSLFPYQKEAVEFAHAGRGRARQQR